MLMMISRENGVSHQITIDKKLQHLLIKLKSLKFSDWFYV